MRECEFSSSLCNFKFYDRNYFITTCPWPDDDNCRKTFSLSQKKIKERRREGEENLKNITLIASASHRIFFIVVIIHVFCLLNKWMFTKIRARLSRTTFSSAPPPPPPPLPHIPHTTCKLSKLYRVRRRYDIAAYAPANQQQQKLSEKKQTKKQMLYEMKVSGIFGRMWGASTMISLCAWYWREDKVLLLHNFLFCWMQSCCRTKAPCATHEKIHEPIFIL